GLERSPSMSSNQNRGSDAAMEETQRDPMTAECVAKRDLCFLYSYLLHVYQLLSSWRESNGTVLATRSALTGSNRPVPRPRTAAQETVVRRAVAPAHARALRRNLDRR